MTAQQSTMTTEQFIANLINTDDESLREFLLSEWNPDEAGQELAALFDEADKIAAKANNWQ